MLFVDVSRSVEGVLRHRVSRPAGAAADVAEVAREVPPPQRREAPEPAPSLPTLLSAQLVKALRARDGNAYVDELERLKAESEEKFLQALHVAFDPACVPVFTLFACQFLVTVARNFLQQLSLSKERWVRVVIAAASAENAAVLDGAVRGAKGADAGTLAAAEAYVKAWRDDGSTASADGLANALARCR